MNGEVIEKIKNHVREKFEKESSGHDWWHIERVWKNAVKIGEGENVDMYVVQLAALLHDIEDFKLHDGDTFIGPKIAREILEEHGVEEDVIEHVCDIVATISFKGAGAEEPMKTKEGSVVRDADRLDAMGAIGISRCFAYGGHKGNVIHNPEIKPKLHDNVKEYLDGWNGESTQINHFHEKLFLLKNLMLTEAGKKMAEKRHEFMESYLNQFLKEWEGEK